MIIETAKLREQELRAEIKKQEFIIREANFEIRRIQGELSNLLSEFEMGDKVYCANFKENPVCVITGVQWKYSGVTYIGKRTKKDGTIGDQEYELYGNITKVED